MGKPNDLYKKRQKIFTGTQAQCQALSDSMENPNDYKVASDEEMEWIYMRVSIYDTAYAGGNDVKDYYNVRRIITGNGITLEFADGTKKYFNSEYVIEQVI